jgi:colanic acid biosynthesis glycosyl transferase WcaI
MKTDRIPRILIVSQHFPPDRSGNASRIADMSYQLQNSGVQVTVLSPHPSFPSGAFRRVWKNLNIRFENNTRIINLWTWQPNSGDPTFLSRMGYYLIFPIHAIIWYIFHFKEFDIIMTSAPPIFTGLPGLFAEKILKKPWIMDVRDLWIDASITLGFLEKDSAFEKISRKYERICYSAANLICVTTHELGRRILKTYKKIDEDKIKITSNGVDTMFFYPVPIKKKNQIIYAGNIGHAQDLEKVILSMKKIRERINLKFLIVGDGDIKTQLEAFTKENKLSDCISFIGLVPREEMPRMFSESLIGLAPLKRLSSLEYAVPTKAYEYMACGIPFLGCGNGEIRNLAERSGGGVIADNSSDAIADAILNLLNDPEKMSEMGANGRAYVKKFYDRKQIAMSLKENIGDIVNAGSQ